MTRSSHTHKNANKVISCAEQLYLLCLRLYPESFRRDYALRMTRVFRDSCRDTLHNRGIAGLIQLGLYTLSDLIISASLERWHTLKESNGSMTAYRHTQNIPPRLWVALITTVIAFTASLLASLNLYLLEDASHLTRAAYSTVPLLRFSYDGIYISALSAGVAICAIVGYAFVQRKIFVTSALIMITLLIAFAGFGGLIIRQPATFLVLFIVFMTLTLLSFLTGHAVATRASHVLAQRPAALLGACVSTGFTLFVNVIALVFHTLILNPSSHALYMQGQIPDTHLNSSLIAMVAALLAMLACLISVARALRSPSHHP